MHPTLNVRRWLKTRALLIAILWLKPLLLPAQTQWGRPSSASVGLDKALDLYGELSHRTVLQHPSLAKASFSFTSTSTNQAEVLTRIEQALETSGIIAIPDGEKFVLVGMKSQAGALVPGATNLTSATEKVIPRGSINLANASVAQVLAFHAELLGKKLDPTSPLPVAGEVSLRQTCDLTKAEVIYALKTLAHWKSWDLLSIDDHLVRVVPIPRPPALPDRK